MALVGSTYLSYGAGHWSTLFATPPASLSTAGVALPDGSRFVVELAVITAANVDNSPTVTWVDITGYVSSLQWLTGTADGALSRWTLEQCNVTTADLTAVVGDFVELPPLTDDTGPGPGSFLRWGFVTPAGAWSPRQSMIVETIDDLSTGRVRGWRFQCYGTLLYYAGLEYRRFTTTLTGNINTAINTVITDWPGELSDYPWPWAVTLAAQNAAFPTDLTAAVIVAGSTWPYLSLLHRMADSQGMRLYNTPTGGIITQLWDTFTDTTFRLTDETRVAVDGHGLVPGSIQGVPKWRRTLDQNEVWLTFMGQGGGTVVGYTVTKWGRRHDAPGWPITDALCTPTAPQALALVNAAGAILLGNELRLDLVTVDTAADAGAWSLMTGPVPLWPACRFIGERRRPGTAWLETPMLTLGVGGSIDFTTGKGHATVDYYTRILAA